jgi:hypothetical protein
LTIPDWDSLAFPFIAFNTDGGQFNLFFGLGPHIALGYGIIP